MGVSFRIYFSPARIKSWIEAELKRQPAKIDLQFQSAQLSLSRGAIPQLAIRLTDVQGRSARSCAKEPGFHISEIYIPFRLVPLFQGRVAVGTVHGRTLVVDLDALRDRCDSESLMKSDREVESVRAEAATSKGKAEGEPSSSEPSSSQELTTGSVRPWWTPAQIQTVQNLVSGLSFDLIELKFERAKKQILFEDVSVRADVASHALSLATDVRVPPELLYGQQLPPFALEATVRPDSADVEIKGNLAEGSLSGLATLKAMPGDVMLDAHVQATSIPLSALLPFIRRAGWMTQDLQPKFLWLQCEAAVRGQIRHLFREHPVRIEKCALEGESGKIALDQATFGPGDRMEPFEITLAGVDIERALAMFGRKGPSGVMSKFGRLSGRVQVKSRDDIVFDGALLDAQFLFSRQSVRVQQPVPEIRGRMDYRDGRWRMAAEEIQLTGGTFAGRVSVEMEKDLSAGKLDVAISDFRPNPAVQKLLIGGEWEQLTLSGQGEIREGLVGLFKGDLRLGGVKGAQIRARELIARATLEGGQAKLDGTIVEGAFLKASRAFEVMAPIFLGHDWTEEWIDFSDAHAQLSLQDRDLRWEKASALLRKKQIWVSSAGTWKDGGGLQGWVSVDFPKLKKLRWDLSGTTREPKLSPGDRVRRETGGRSLKNTDLGLFIPVEKSSQSIAPAGSAR